MWHARLHFENLTCYVLLCSCVIRRQDLNLIASDHPAFALALARARARARARCLAPAPCSPPCSLSPPRRRHLLFARASANPTRFDALWICGVHRLPKPFLAESFYAPATASTLPCTALSYSGPPAPLPKRGSTHHRIISNGPPITANRQKYPDSIDSRIASGR